MLEILDELDPDKREVSALTELEQLTAPEVAEPLGVPLNTIYSRLRLARVRFEQGLARRAALRGLAARSRAARGACAEARAVTRAAVTRAAVAGVAPLG